MPRESYYIALVVHTVVLQAFLRLVRIVAAFRTVGYLVALFSNCILVTMATVRTCCCPSRLPVIRYYSPCRLADFFVRQLHDFVLHFVPHVIPPDNYSFNGPQRPGVWIFSRPSPPVTFAVSSSDSSTALFLISSSMVITS